MPIQINISSNWIVLRINLTPTQIKRDMMKMISYTSAIWSIMYVILCTWLDVFYTLSIMSTYQSNLGEIH
jgi:hypothetical protein